MATKSNFKRAAPAEPRKLALAPLRNMQLVDSKAVLPAGRSKSLCDVMDAR
jgi:recyclin-1